jgi:hypothetical protein
MFQPPSLPDLNIQLIVPLVISGLLISAAIAYTWQRHKPSRVKLIPVYIALGVGLFLLPLLTQPHFRTISQTCKDYQLQKTLYSSTPGNSSCDREIADSEASYLAAYPIIANRQSPPVYLGLLTLGGGLVVTLKAQGSLRRTRQDHLRPGT